MPTWNDEARREAFADNDNYRTRYCRLTPDSATTLAGIGDGGDEEITRRREISCWLSVVAPNAFHRSPGHDRNNRPWLTVGRVEAGGRVEGNSRIGVVYFNRENWVGIRQKKSAKYSDFEELLITDLNLANEGLDARRERLMVTKDAYEQLRNKYQPTVIKNGADSKRSQAVYLCWSYDQLRRDSQLNLLGALFRVLDSTIYSNLPPNAEMDWHAMMPSVNNQGEGPEPPQTPHSPTPPMKTTNLILYGPPGTGKTFATLGLALHYCGSEQADVDNYASACVAGKYSEPPDTETWIAWLDEFEELRNLGQIEFTTFHQNYAYEDFVEGIRPQTNAGAVSYVTEPGIFKKIAYRALYAWLKGDGKPCPIGHEEEKGARKAVLQWLEKGTRDQTWEPDPSDTKAPAYVLVIDEINRGNMARILGELITLLEDSKRARHQLGLGHQPLKATLPYTREPFIVPPNLYIIGTMNTADRSLIGLDVALRRRFHFVELPPKPKALSTNVAGVNLQAFLAKLNENIEGRLDADHLIGHAFFANVNSIDQIRSVMIQKVIPLLREYFHDRPEDLKGVLNVPGGLQFLQFAGQGRNLRFDCVNPSALANPEVYRLFSGADPQ